MNRTALTLGSLFDGSGGFPLGGLLAGIIPVWASEIEPFPIRVTTKRMPFMKHYGNVQTLDGASVEPVDIITFGSPCQDMSIAGKREGLDAARSGLFFEAIRIIAEMRVATNGKYPRYIVWENVPGAFSSNKGEDFRCVLESIAKVKDDEAHVPKPQKWEHAGFILGHGYSISWRLLDAQFWGVPQRRKRIFLVADFGGESAGKILFESEGLSGYSAESFRAWQRITSGADQGFGKTSINCLNDQGGQRMDVSKDITGTLRARSGNQPLVFENHAQDLRFNGPLEVSQTVLSTFGTGGNNQPLVVDEPKTLKIRSGCPGGGKGALLQNNKSATLGCHNDQTVFVPQEPQEPEGTVWSSNKASFFTKAEKDLAGALVATDWKDPPLVNDDGLNYTVRRLTPTECARLQGFPDWWCAGLETKDPTEDEIDFWRGVFETWRKVTNPEGKEKTERQIRKWLSKPHSDSAEYKMWGNGVALPCVFFVLSGIAYCDSHQ